MHRRRRSRCCLQTLPSSHGRAGYTPGGFRAAALFTVAGIAVITQVGVDRRRATRQQGGLAVGGATRGRRDDLYRTGRYAIAGHAVVAQGLVDAGVLLLRIRVAEPRVARIADADGNGVRRAARTHRSSRRRTPARRRGYRYRTADAGHFGSRRRIAGLEAVALLLVVVVDRLPRRADGGDRVADFRAVAWIEVVAERDARQAPAGERVAGLDAVARMVSSM